MSSRRGRGSGQSKRSNANGFEEWGGYMQAKIQKLQDQFQNDKPIGGAPKLTSTIFKGISIHVNGYTNPTSDELKKLMTQHGGIYHHYYSRNIVTHIIASNLPNSKVANLTDKKVVKPEWITESVKAGKLLPYEDFLLVTGRGKIQPGLFSKRKGSFQEKTGACASPITTVLSAPEASSPLNVDALTSSSVNQSDLEFESYEGDDDRLSPVLPYVEETDSIAESDNLSPVLPFVGNETEFRHFTYKEQEESFNPPEKLDITKETSSIVPAVEGSHKKNAASAHTAEPLSGGGFKSVAKSGDPNFVAEFYNNSRLHYLSTWGAEFRAYVNSLQSKGDVSFPGRVSLNSNTLNLGEEKRISGKPLRVVMHVDMDSFFVSVGIRNRPDLLGKPIAVTHSRGVGASRERPGTDLEYEKRYWKSRSAASGKETPPANANLGSKDGTPKDSASFHSMAEIASCSYEARKLGVKNGMFMGTAKKLCPDLVTIPYDFEGYRAVSQTLYDIVASFTHDIEAVSCDEMMVDCTDLLADTGADPLEFVATLRKEIKEQTGCNASAGLGSNMLLARLATRKAKPNGQFYLENSKILEFLEDRPVSDLPGVGWSVTKKLRSLDVKTCGEVKQISLSVLQKEFGPKSGKSLYDHCRGIDNRDIKVERERKSVSAEINYGIRFKVNADVDKFINELAEEVHNRLEKINVKGKTITLKLKIRKSGAPKETAKFLGHGVCDNITKSVTLPLATDNPSVIAKECLGIIRPMRLPADDFRGVGIQVTRLESPVGSNDRRGMQSILNFTTKSIKPVQSEVKDLPVSESAENAERLCTEQALVRDDEGAAEPAISESDEKDRFPVSKRTLPPLPVLPEITSPLVDISFRASEFTMASMGDVEWTPSPSVGEKTPTQNSTYTSSLYVPSPSQLDPEVLAQLPDDIRLQIEQAVAQKAKAGVSKKREEKHNDGAALRPSCSYSVTDRGSTGSTEEAISALPNLSQIDPGCLEALPEDVRAELLGAYQKQLSARELNREEAKPQIHPLMLPQFRNSPGKSPKKSPGKFGKRPSPRKSPGSRSPLFKVPVGRPPPSGGKPKPPLSARKTLFGESDRPTVNDEELHSGVVGLDDPINFKRPEISDVPTPSLEFTASKKPSLCGAVTIGEVRQLIREWVLSCEGPSIDDEQQFITYVEELIQLKELEMIDLSLKSLKRMSTRKGTNGWLEAFHQILDQTQAIVKSVYGMWLKFPS